MATGGTPPNSGPNPAPSELPPDPPHTELSSQPLMPSIPNSAAAKPYKLNTSSPSPANSVPLQVHVPPGLGGQLPHATRTLPGGLLAQPHYAAQIPQGQAGLMPFPYGGGLIAAAGAPRAGAGMAPLPGAIHGMGAQPIMMPGGGIMRHQRGAMAPVMHHPYQRVAPVPQAATQQVPGYQMMPAARAIQPHTQAVQTPYGQMLVQVVQPPGPQYRVHPGAALQQMQGVQMPAMDPTSMAALYAQYTQAAYNPYLQQLQQLQQLQHPSAAVAAVASQAMPYGQQPYAAAYTGAREQQQYAAAYAGAREQQAASSFDPQKLLNAHYSQMLVPEQCNMSPSAATTGLNGTSSDYDEQNS